MTALNSVIGFFKIVIVFFTSFSQLLTPLALKIVKGGEDAFFEQWSAQQAYTEDYAVTLEKDPAKDFVVLNLTDIQLGDIDSYGEGGNIAFYTVRQLVAETQPDLITLTGDNAWATYAYLRLVSEIDSYGIPWAPVMGNHDGQGCPSEFWCAEQFATAENCLFKFGPANMGYGNYIINITENGEIIHTLFMMDTHSGADDTPAGAINGAGGYDGFWQGQLDWYKWAVTGIAGLAGKTVQSSVLVHIPVYEYRLAWAEAYDENAQTYVGEYADGAFGEKHEGICSPEASNGFFDMAKELGSTKDIIAGHDHVNNFSVEYQGIRLSYSLKTGSGCYWESNMSGGSTLSIASDGTTTFDHVYVDPVPYQNMVDLGLFNIEC